MSNEVKTNLESIFQSFQEMIKVETVVGEALHIGDAILVPFVDVRSEERRVGKECR